jgi:uncharacterized protein DUF4242
MTRLFPAVQVALERVMPGGCQDRTTLRARPVRGSGKDLERSAGQAQPELQWVESYVAKDKMFCVYLAKDIGAIQRHAELVCIPPQRALRSSE